MRVFKNNLIYIKALSGALIKDPSSFEGWKCVYLESESKSDTFSNDGIIGQLAPDGKNKECDIVLCQDETILFFSKTMEAGDLLEFANKAIIAFEEKFRVEQYNLYLDWSRVGKLLESKIAVTDPKERIGLKEGEHHDFGEIYSLEEVFMEAKNLRRGRQPLHVMLVEDNSLTRHLVATAFKDKYVLITAKDAYEAVANYLVYAPDIVFLDIGLPDVNGLAVLTQILESDPDAYVVMFSGNSYLDNITTALNAGASGFIAKPFNKEKMKRYIADSAFHHNKLKLLIN